jgi:stearoyl-CoA desaturase (delta-9 desaturase)
VQGPVISWVADHRKHHAHTDAEGDPHSPHGHGSGFKGAVKGLWYAHMGWLFDRQGTSAYRKYAKDLVEDPTMRRINKLFPLWVVVGIALPAALGYLIGGTVTAALTGALWGGLVRVFLLHHITWSINSVCHFFGTRRFDVEDQSTNVFWLAPLSLGESWHHNHHAFPRSAVHGLRWWEIDITAWVIRGMKASKLAWNVVEISPERQEQKLSKAAEPPKVATPA